MTEDPKEYVKYGDQCLDEALESYWAAIAWADKKTKPNEEIPIAYDRMIKLLELFASIEGMINTCDKIITSSEEPKKVYFALIKKSVIKSKGDTDDFKNAINNLSNAILYAEENDLNEELAVYTCLYLKDKVLRSNNLINKTEEPYLYEELNRLIARTQFTSAY